MSLHEGRRLSDLPQESISKNINYVCFRTFTKSPVLLSVQCNRKICYLASPRHSAQDTGGCMYLSNIRSGMLSIAFISPKAAYCMIGRMAKLADDQREAAIILVAKLKIVGMSAYLT